MISSAVLAKLLGFILIIVTSALLVNRKNFSSVLRQYEHTMPILFKGVVNVLLGIVLLLFHNSWTTSLDIATSLFCWLILVLGVVNLFCADRMTGVVAKIRKNKNLGTTALVVFFIIGVCFVYAGFTQ